MHPAELPHPKLLVPGQFPAPNDPIMLGSGLKDSSTANKADKLTTGAKQQYLGQ